MSYNPEENLEIIDLFKRLRVTDVRDGMDWMGYHHYGSVHHSIRPLFRPRSSTIGIARTTRYIPYEGPLPDVIRDEYTDWVKMYYEEIDAGNAWASELQPGDFVCMDTAQATGVLSVGMVGSANSLWHKKLGCVGWLTDGGVRDTDENVIQGINVWAPMISQNMGQARVRYVDKNCPIGIGGVAIYPGDVVVADGDGVIIVPRKMARDVAKYAWQEASNDKKGRKRMYIDLGMELDETVD